MIFWEVSKRGWSSHFLLTINISSIDLIKIGITVFSINVFDVVFMD